MQSNRTQPDAGHRGWENPAVTLDEAYYRDPQRAYLLLSRAMMRQTKETEGDYTLLPMMGLIEVLTVEIYERHRHTILRIWAKALRYDGRVDILEYEEYETIDPGYFDTSIRWQNLDDQGKVIEWRPLYVAKRVIGTTSDTALALRRAKLKYLYYALYPQVRIHLSETALEVNALQYDDAMRQLGRVLMDLPETNNIWTTRPKQDGVMSPNFPSRGH